MLLTLDASGHPALETEVRLPDFVAPFVLVDLFGERVVMPREHTFEVFVGVFVGVERQIRPDGKVRLEVNVGHHERRPGRAALGAVAGVQPANQRVHRRGVRWRGGPVFRRHQGMRKGRLRLVEHDTPAREGAADAQVLVEARDALRCRHASEAHRHVAEALKAIREAARRQSPTQRGGTRADRQSDDQRDNRASHPLLYLGTGERIDRNLTSRVSRASVFLLSASRWSSYRPSGQAPQGGLGSVGIRICPLRWTECARATTGDSLLRR